MRSFVGGWSEDGVAIPADDFDPAGKDFGSYEFVSSAGWFLTEPIEQPLAGTESEDQSKAWCTHTATLRRCLALVDKRVGKRTLRRLAPEMLEAPPLVRYFYALRCEAEGIPVSGVNADAMPRA